MTEEEANGGLHITARKGAVKPQNPTPRSIAAQSQARNSYTRILILGGLLALLTAALFVALFVRPEHVKDLLLVISSIAAYLAGSGDWSRKDEK